jgi:hypothetical protein
VVKREHTNDKAVDFAPLLTSIKAQNPDAIFFGGYDQQAAPMARQMKALGMGIKLMGGETMNSAKFIELAGPAAEGHIASTPGAALESRPGGNAFAARYKARYGQDIGLYAPYFYDGVMLIVAAMKAADSTDPAKYLPALAKVKHNGITANVEFDARGDRTSHARPRTVQSREIRPRGAVVNIYTQRFGSGGICAELRLRALFWQDISLLARDMHVDLRRRNGSVPSRRWSSSCSGLNCTTMMPTSIRRPASLPMPKSRSRNGCDVSSRNDTSRHPGHPLRPRNVRAIATESILLLPRAVLRSVSGLVRWC